jgi:hypothetical protein
VSTAIDQRQARGALVDALRAQRAEIEEAVRVRIYSVGDPREAGDPEYVTSLSAAIPAAIDYGLEGIERGDEHPPPPPTVLLAQARFAARNRVSLDTVLRRYFGGYTLLGDFLVEEAEAQGVRGSELTGLLHAQAALLDRLLAAVSEEYGREQQSRPDTIERRRAEQVRRLLAGERLNVPELEYELGGWHLGLVAVGHEARKALSDLATSVDSRVLSVAREKQTVWAWLGSRRRLDPEDLLSALTNHSKDLRLALGEPGEGLAGWRLTHRQALAALPIALRSQRGVTRYIQVAFVAAILGDEVLSTSLRQIYLAPLERHRDGGKAARETLRAYFDCGRNVSSAAAVLAVRRQTVAARLQAVEERLGRLLGDCSAELESALRLEELDSP